MNRQSPKVRHIRVWNEHGEMESGGGATIAYREVEDGTAEFSVAYCSPQDNFNKATGRLVASGKLNSRLHRCKTEMTLNYFEEELNELQKDDYWSNSMLAHELCDTIGADIPGAYITDSRPAYATLR